VTLPTANPAADFDYDQDGVPDLLELPAGSNPDASDTDGDSTTDGLEYDQGSNPADASHAGMPPTSTQDWVKHITFNSTYTLTGKSPPYDEVKESRVIILPLTTPMPASLHIVWSADDGIILNGDRYAGTGTTALLASARIVQVDLIDTYGFNWGGWVEFTIVPDVPPVPSISFPGDLPGDQSPGDGFEWVGKPDSVPGDGNGNWYNKNTDESLRNDMRHAPPIGPHWDYWPTGNNGKWRWFPDGRMERVT
jgi:hypothetical protein